MCPCSLGKTFSFCWDVSDIKEAGLGRDVHTNMEECQKKNLKILSLLMNICLKHKANHLYDHYCTTSLAGAQITILVLFRNLITTWMLVKANIIQLCVLFCIFCCPGFSWHRVNFLPRSWHRAVLWI